MMKMNYIVLGTNDLDASICFYDSLFEETELKRVLVNDRMAFWQGNDEDSAFAVAIPFDQKPANNGNGTMFGFGVASVEEVIRLHNKAIELGGTCEGMPHQRGTRFSAYVRDLDKNKIAFAVSHVR